MKVIESREILYNLSIDQVKDLDNGSVVQGSSTKSYYIKGRFGVTRLIDGTFTDWMCFGGGSFRLVEAEVHVK